MELVDRSKGLGDDMAAFRRRNVMSMRECATGAGVSLQTWYSIEHGAQKPRSGTRSRIEAFICERSGSP